MAKEETDLWVTADGGWRLRSTRTTRRTATPDIVNKPITEEATMGASQDHISASTPMGANAVAGGATFRVWAPGAARVCVAFDGSGPPPQINELVKDLSTGHWTGYFPGVGDGTKYRYWVEGAGSAGLKRDQWARELEFGDYHDTDCIVREPQSYRWHDADFAAPEFSDMVVYQLHVGVFHATTADGQDHRPGRVARFLDAIDRIEYLVDLGVNAIQPLPFVEFRTPWSLGYRKQHHYLTIVADHHTGDVVWADGGKDTAAAERFYDALGDARSHRLRAVSMDMGKAYPKVTPSGRPDVRRGPRGA